MKEKGANFFEVGQSASIYDAGNSSRVLRVAQNST